MTQAPKTATGSAQVKTEDLAKGMEGLNIEELRSKVSELSEALSIFKQ